MTTSVGWQLERLAAWIISGGVEQVEEGRVALGAAPKRQGAEEVGMAIEDIGNGRCRAVYTLPAGRSVSEEGRPGHALMHGVDG